MFKNFSLTDNFVVINPPYAEDLSEIYVAVRESLKELHPWMDWATESYDQGSVCRWLEHVQQSWSHSSAFQFAIKDVSSGQFQGVCGLDGINKKSRCFNLSYWVRTGAVGRGIATRALLLALRFGFQELGLVRAEIVIAADNQPSIRVAHKVGAHYETLRKESLFVRTDVHDAVLFSINRVEFENGTID